MFARLLLLSYICIFAVVADGPQSLKTAEDDANAAFQQYSRNASLETNFIINFLDKHYDHSLKLMYELNQKIAKTVNEKLDATIRAIQHIQDGLISFNITTCSYDYSALIEKMRGPLLNRTAQCVNLYKEVYRTVHNSSCVEASLLMNNMVGCQSRSLQQCKSYHKTDDCYRFLISNFQKAATVITDAYGLMRVNTENKFNSVRPHCEELTNFKISVWPDYYLQTVTKCADNELRSLRQTACPYDVSLNK